MIKEGKKWDIIFAGGGLANGLLAYRLKQSQPSLDILIVDKDPVLGGNHTWSFYQSDLTPAQRSWVAPFIVHQWPGYEVRFSSYSRVLETGYFSMTSAKFHEVISEALGPHLLLGAEISELASDRIVLADGRVLEARAVIDGRGVVHSDHLVLGYQKFLGWEVELEQPHRQKRPVIMDATVEQLDGYRFVYTLPFDETRLLIEDTYYSDLNSFSREALEDGIRSYASDRAWSIKTVLREEEGVLPITMAGDIERFWQEGDPDVARTGLRAALFHPITGYSLLEAVKLADHVCTAPVDQLNQQIRLHSKTRWAEYRFCRLLNRMLFRAAAPEKRHRVFERFYRLPDGLIERFYAGNLAVVDKIRLLTGKPPVPLMAAAKCLSENQFLRNKTKQDAYLEA